MSDPTPMFEVPGSRLRELRDVENERDRYRAALEQITRTPPRDWHLNVQIARAALTSSEAKT